jgi:hypothetical protein
MSSRLLEPKADHRAADEVARMVGAFEACTLAGERWTHEAHLRVALWYLWRHGAAEATARGVAQTIDGGYHETITLFYVHVVARYVKGAGAGASLAALVDGLMAACGDKHLPFEYYSRERLFSWTARTSWVVPDLKALD